MVQRMKTLAARLKIARAEAGINQKELAKRVSVSQQAISKIEAGKAKATYIMVPLANALDVNLEWLSAGTGPMRGDNGNVVELNPRNTKLTAAFSKLTRKQREAVVALIQAMAEPGK